MQSSLTKNCLLFNVAFFHFGEDLIFREPRANQISRVFLAVFGNLSTSVSLAFHFQFWFHSMKKKKTFSRSFFFAARRCACIILVWLIQKCFKCQAGPIRSRFEFSYFPPNTRKGPLNCRKFQHVSRDNSGRLSSNYPNFSRSCGHFISCRVRNGASEYH